MKSLNDSYTYKNQSLVAGCVYNLDLLVLYMYVCVHIYRYEGLERFVLCRITDFLL